MEPQNNHLGRSESIASVDSRIRSAISLQRQGRWDEAAHEYGALIKDNLADFDCFHSFGLLRAQQGNFEQAAELISEAVRRNQRSVGALINLGNVLAMLSRHEEAMAWYQQAIALNPNYADAHNNLGNALQALGRYTEAVDHYHKALAINPRLSKAHNNLGNVFEALNRHKDAIQCYEKALAISPNDPEVHNNMGVSLVSLKRLEEAIAHYRKAVAINPSYAQAHNNLGAALMALDRHDEALVSYQRAIALKSDYAEAFSNMGDAFRQIGRAEEAGNAYERAIKLVPGRPAFYRRLASTKRLAAGDPHIGAMRRLAEDKALSALDRVELHFALAKTLADLGRHEESFQHLLEGNTLHRQHTEYDEAETLDFFRRIRTVFTSDLMHSKQGFGDPSKVPVFVVGMIRSGTSLVEQILASHPKVYGAGELTNFARIAACIGRGRDVPVGFPESFSSISAAELRQLGADYIDSIKAAAPHAERIIDKMPANFRLTGAIYLVLPQARIIHVRRDPVDTCLSCFSTLFAGDQPFAYDLAELGRFYRAYEMLMEHWRRVLPPGVMLEIEYEQLIAHPEDEARRMLAHCGLEWDAHCLLFHQTQRPVKTASALQVRQPIYRTSVGRKRPDTDRLQPLLAALHSTAPTS